MPQPCGARVTGVRRLMELIPAEKSPLVSAGLASTLELVRYKVLAELKAEMSRAYLGLMWWVAEPVLYMATFYLVFGVLFQRGGPGYPAFLICGLVVWRWIDSSVRTGATVLLANQALLGQVYVPKWVFPLSLVLANGVKYVVLLVLLLAFLGLAGPGPQWSWSLLPVLVVVQLLLVVFLAGFVAAVVPFLPDLTIVVNNLMTLLLFLSGIFFSVDTIPGAWQRIFWLNPVAVMVDAYRDVLIEGGPPALGRLAAVALFAVAGIALTGWLYHRYDRVYPKLVV